MFPTHPVPYDILMLTEHSDFIIVFGTKILNSLLYLKVKRVIMGMTCKLYCNLIDCSQLTVSDDIDFLDDTISLS